MEAGLLLRCVSIRHTSAHNPERDRRQAVDGPKESSRVTHAGKGPFLTQGGRRSRRRAAGTPQRLITGHRFGQGKPELGARKHPTGAKCGPSGASKSESSRSYRRWAGYWVGAPMARILPIHSSLDCMPAVYGPPHGTNTGAHPPKARGTQAQLAAPSRPIAPAAPPSRLHA